MSLYGAFDKTKHLEELNEPLFTNEGVKTPSARKAEARAALGIDEQVAALAEAGIADPRFTGVVLFNLTSTAVNTTATMTAAALLGGHITSTSAAAVVATLPLATSLETAIQAANPNVAVGDSFYFTVRNTGPSSFTVTTNTGWTLTGDMIIETTTTGSFLARRTSATTYTLDRV